jgi:hypothetical protein
MADADTSTPARSPALLVIGDFFSPAMQPVRLCVERLVENACDARFRAGVPETAVSLGATLDGEPWYPDLVVVCQHWPDEFTERDVRRLLTLSPLARLSCCYGPWCQSDGRSRDIWPLATRVPVESAAGRIARELEVLAGLRRPLPLTASRDEVFLFDTPVR